ncbi:NAD(+) diphosphatase [Anaeromusa acidaminophila]|uniref:NAD(+) diphosphatase n=1 Tax=Anaeromusa acidaminophila TaxID=81464 RepID=UPI0003611DA8|nr:NAD(+) diphosphatase [Anaeromusa acidaminophila]
MDQMNEKLKTISEHAYWFLFHRDELLMKETADGLILPSQEDLSDLPYLSAKHAQYIGSLDSNACFAATISSEDVPPGFALQKLRGVYGLVDDDAFRLAFRSYHVRTWLKNNRFCGACGQATQPMTEELAVRCPQCGHIAYPRISPAIIVAVTKGDEILLAHSNRLPPGRYSVIAGFVEPGETLEECVRRELAEEVGIEVTDIRYFGNQPWPFPDSLMVAFTATAVSSEITIDNNEILDAGWYSPHNLPPNLPGQESIARRLIDAYLAKFS